MSIAYLNYLQRMRGQGDYQDHTFSDRFIGSDGVAVDDGCRQMGDRRYVSSPNKSAIVWQRSAIMPQGKAWHAIDVTWSAFEAGIDVTIPFRDAGSNAIDDQNGTRVGLWIDTKLLGEVLVYLCHCGSASTRRVYLGIESDRKGFLMNRPLSAKKNYQLQTKFSGNMMAVYVDGQIHRYSKVGSPVLKVGFVMETQKGNMSCRLHKFWIDSNEDA